MLVGDVTNKDATRITPDCDVLEALHQLMEPRPQHLLTVVSPLGEVQGVITKTDILRALQIRKNGSTSPSTPSGR